MTLLYKAGKRAALWKNDTLEPALEHRSGANAGFYVAFHMKNANRVEEMLLFSFARTEK